MSVSASTASRLAFGIFSNAELIGAKIVNGPGPLSVSTRPAAVTAATSVDSSGLLLAAVAAGSSAMPAKLPSPSLGTLAQPGPDGAIEAPMSVVIGSGGVGSVATCAGRIPAGAL